MLAGDTCYIRDGTYRETIIPANSGQIANPVVFTAYRDERVSRSVGQISSTDPGKNIKTIFILLKWTGL